MPFSTLKLTLFGACLTFAARLQADPTAQQLAERLDFVRRPDQSFEVKLNITELHDGKAEQQSELRVMARKHAGSLRFDVVAQCLAPAADSGKTLLVTPGELWFYDPKAARPTRVSMQHFLGRFSLSDALSTSFAAEYDSELAGEETIRDAARADVLCLRLRMKRRDKEGTAPEIVEYWVDKERLQPVRGRFYSANGTLLRSSYYAGYTRVLGEIRPTRVLVVSHTEQGVVTDIRFGGFELHEWPEAMFAKEALERVSRGRMP